MRRYILIVITFTLFFALTAAAPAAPVEVGLGTLKLGGVLQTVYGYSQAAKWSFAEKRVRIILNGDLPEQRLKYLVQLEALGSPALLDARVQAVGWLPRTDVFLGRFLPAFGIYMPRSTASLEMINYPLITTRHAMWRQMGLETTTRFKPVELSLGIFNGYPANNFSDNNRGKDLLGSITARPWGPLQVMGYVWQGSAVMRGANDTLRDRLGGGLSLERAMGGGTSLTVRCEASSGQDKPRPAGLTARGGGYYFHVGYRPHPKLEVLGRWDKYDTQDTDDGTAWLTGGVNWYISGNNVVLYANYIHKELELPGAPRNNEFLVQAQVAF